MKRCNSASRRPERRRGTTLPSKFYPTAELLQRFEDAMAKSGLSISRSGLICQRIEAWATSKGC